MPALAGLLLAGLALGQAPAADAYFGMVAEEFVVAATAATAPEDLVDARTAWRIAALGCGRHGCRELATADLAAAGNVRALYLAARHADPEVAHRGRELLAAYFACWHCAGDGVCPFEKPPWPGGNCSACSVPRDSPAGFGRGLQEAAVLPWSGCRPCRATGDWRTARGAPLVPGRRDP